MNIIPFKRSTVNIYFSIKSGEIALEKSKTQEGFALA